MFIETMTAHDENMILINAEHIVLVTYFPESNMSRIDTVVPGAPIWVDDNFIDKLNKKGAKQ